MSENTATLAAKIAKIIGEIQPIEKRGNNGLPYNFTDASDVRAVMRKVLSENNIAILQDVESSQIVDGWIHTVYRFTLICGHTGATLSGAFPQTTPMSMGNRSDDKVSGKASTYAMKYWLMGLFQISDTAIDDLDNDSEEKAPPPRRNSATQSRGSAPSGTQDYTMNITEIKAINGTKGIFYVMGDASMFDHAPLLELGYQPETINKLAQAGTYQLPDAVDVKWEQSGKYKNIISLRRKSTGQTVQIAG